jgi:hypothetical protein
MPVHVQEMTSDVEVIDGDMPLSDAQLKKIVDMVLRCLEDRHRTEKWTRDATALRRSVLPKTTIEG